MCRHPRRRRADLLPSPPGRVSLLTAPSQVVMLAVVLQVPQTGAIAAPPAGKGGE
jgi:hypothetical protein